MKPYYILFLLLIAFASVSAQTQSPEAKARMLLNVNGSKPNFDAAIEQLIDLQARAMRDLLPAEFFEEFKREMLETGYDEISELIIPIYLKYFSEEEMDGMIAFYRTDLGQMMVNKTPLIMQESMAVGQQWGGAMGATIAERLQNVDQLLYEFEYEKDLSRFRKGNYKEVGIEGSQTAFSRYENKQCEKNGPDESCYQIGWQSNNRYTLQKIDQQGKVLDESPTVVNIYGADEIGYQYIVKLSDGTYLKGEVQSSNKKL